MAIVRVSGVVNSVPNGNQTISVPNGSFSVVAGTTASIVAGSELDITGGGVVQITAVSTVSTVAGLVTTASNAGSYFLYFANTNGIYPNYLVTGTNIAVGSIVTTVTNSYSVGLSQPLDGNVNTGTFILFVPVTPYVNTYVNVSATNFNVLGGKSITKIEGQLVVGPHVTTSNNTTTVVTTLLINSTSTANVGNPDSMNKEGQFPPPAGVYDTSTNRVFGSVYIPGGLGVEKDLNVGGYIYGRVAAATSSTLLIVTNTNTTTDFYPVFTKDIFGKSASQLYGSSSTFINPTVGLKYNPGTGLLTTNQMFVASTANTYSTSTFPSGALVVNGGVAIEKDLGVKGNIIPRGINTSTGSPYPTSTLGNQDERFTQGFIDNVYSNLIQAINSTTNNPDYSAQNINMLPQQGGYVDIFGDIRARGKKPIGTAPVVTNVLWVTMDGDDTNDGRAEDASRACRTISGATKSPYYQPGTQIRVRAGHYLEDNPIELKPYTSVMGSDLRTTSVEAINKTQDLFHVQSGNYLAFMQFTNGRSGLLEGAYLEQYNRGAYCTAFPPLTGKDRIDLFHSPYIQNCTNQSGPWMKDGTMFQPDGTVQVPKVVGTSSWVAGQTILKVYTTGTLGQVQPAVGMYVNSGQQNQGFWNARTLMLANKPFLQEQVVAFVDQAFTQGFRYDKVKCRRDAGFILTGAEYDIALGTNYNGITSGNAYRRGNASSAIVTSTELVQTIGAIGYLKTVVAGIATGNATAITRSNNSFDTTIAIINSGTGATLSFTSPSGRDVHNIYAKNLLVSNRTFLQSEVTAWIGVQVAGNTSPFSTTFKYSTSTCYRDVGYIVDALCYDVLYGGNSASVTAAQAYFVGAASQVPSETAQTVAAFSRLSTVAQQVAQGQTVTKSSGNSASQAFSGLLGTATQATAISGLVGIVTDAITGGSTASIPSPTYPDITWTTTSTQNIVSTINSTTATIIDNMINFINTNYSGFTYNQGKCSRDTGLVVDAIVQDLLFSTSSQSTFAGLQYWNQNGYTGVISTELTTTTNAINYVSSLAQRVIRNITTGTRYQSAVGQNTALPAATVSQATVISTDFKVITDIISTGTSGITDKIVPNGIVASTDGNVLNAYALLQANKSYIQAEAVAYVESTKTAGFVYDQATCYRDVGYMIDSVSFDLLYGGNRQAIQSGVYYYGFSTTSSAIPTERVETVNAYTYLKELIRNVAIGKPLPSPVQTSVTQVITANTGTVTQANLAAASVDTIINIISKGPTVAPAKTPISLTRSASTPVQYAATLINSNRAFIIAEVVAYINKEYGAFDQVKCSRDTGLIVDSIATDLLYQSTSESKFAGLQYWNQKEYVDDIAREITTTTAAVNFVKFLAVNTATAAANSTIGDIVSADFDVILNILNNGTAGVTGLIVSNGYPSTATNVVTAFNALINAIPSIQDQTIDYITNTLGFTSYTTATCVRDVGYMIKSVAFDLLNPDATAGYSNKQAIKSGTYYYGYVSTATAIRNQIPQTTAAYNFIKGIIPSIVTAEKISSTYQSTVTQVTNLTPGTFEESAVLKQKIDIITNIIRNGPGVAGDKIPMDLSTSTNVEIWNAYNLLVANREFIQAETLAYLNNQLFFFDYSREYCFRDVGILVENIAYDAVFGGNEKSVQSGLAYYDGVISRISGQETQTVSAIDYLDQLCRNVITNTTCTNIVDNPTYEQVRNTVLVGGEIASSSITNNFETVINIIQNGPSAAPAIYMGAGPDAAFMSAEILMQANRKFIQQQTINYINWNLARRDFPFSELKCGRDIGLIVDSIASDLRYPLDRTSGSNQAYMSSTFAGLQYWNQNGYTGTIYDEINQTIQAVAYLKDLAVKIVQNITPADDLVPRYSDEIQVTISDASPANPQTPDIAAGTDEVRIIKSEFDIILEILGGQTTGWTDRIIPNGDTVDQVFAGRLAAYRLLQANKEYFAIEVNAYIRATNPNFIYDDVKCARDVGYIIDSVAFDLYAGGNRLAVQSGLSYYTVLGGNSNIPTEITQTVDAFNFVKTLATSIIQNIEVTTYYQTEEKQYFVTGVDDYDATDSINIIDKAINTITNIIQSGPAVAVPLKPNGTDIANPYNTITFARLQANKEFIKAETIAYLEQRYNPDAFKYNEALCYRDTGLIVDAVSQDILLGGNSKSVECGVSYWNKGYNYVAGQETTTTMAINYARDIALQIVANQPVTVITGTTVAQVINPYFQYGGDYMPQQAIGRNFSIITTIIENGPLFAPPVYQGSGLFSATGQLADDVRIAPTVTYVEDAGTPGVYFIGISTSTVGFGNNATLYFGDVGVYPLNDIQVEALSLEYTGNTSTWNTRKLDPIGAMGGSLVDGAVISDLSPINSFVYDAFTQVTQGGHGIKITNNGYAQLVSVFTVFCSVGVQVTNGGIASIVNSNANFGDVCLLAKGYGKRAFSGTLYNPSYKAYPNSPGPDGLNQYYPSGFWPNDGRVQVFLPDVTPRPHISLVMEVEPNPGHLNEQNLPGFLNAQPSLATVATGTIKITGIDNTGIAIGDSVYIRDQYGHFTGTDFVLYADTGTIVTDLGYQSVTLNKALTSGGGDPTNANFFTLFFCGNAYYTVLSSTIAENPKINGTNILSSANTSTEQVAAHIAALRYINTVTDAVVSNTPLATTYQNTFSQIVVPLLAGGAGAIPFIDLRINDTIRVLAEPTTSEEAEALYPTVLRTTSGTVPSGAGSAIALIKQNLDFIAAEVSAYVTSTNVGFVYSTATCARDSGYIIDGVKYDMALGTNYNAVTCGNAYLRGASYNVLNKEKVQTIAAINYIATTTEAIVQGDATALSRAVESFSEITSIINSGTSYAITFTDPTGGNPNRIAAKDKLIANKTFLQTEITSWITSQLVAQIVPFNKFYYDETLCRRDSGYIITGVQYDVALGTNYNAVTSGNAYRRANASSQAVIANELTQTLGAIAYMKSGAATSMASSTTAVARSNSSFDEVSNIISSNNPSALTFTNPSNASSATIAAKDKLIANKAFLQAEVTAWINVQKAGNINPFTSSFTYDSAKCERDVGYIVDALCYDILYGGNYGAVKCAEAYFSGTASQISGETTQTVSAFTRLSTVAQDVIKGISVTRSSGNGITQVTSGNNAGATEASRLNTLISITTSAITAGNIISLPAIDYPSTSWALTEIKTAVTTLAGYQSTLINNTIAYIKTTYDAFTYNQALCYRDVGFLVDALCYDILYGGNSASVVAAQAYYTGTAGTTSVIPGEESQTVAAFNYLSTIAQNVIKGITVTPSSGNTVSQVTSGSNASATEAGTLAGLMTIITNVLTAGNDNGTPTVVNPSISWATSPIQTVVNNLASAKATIISNTISFIDRTFTAGFAYDDAKCRRDIKLILQRLIYDIETGGRYNSVMNGLSYWARNGTHHIVQLGENVRRTDLFPDGATVNFYQRSYISASGYVFEYVGAGTNYGALPQVGYADPVQSKETVQLDSGKVFFTSTDQNGDFRIGPGLVISQATGVLSGRTFTKSLFANLTPFVLAIGVG
jgi:hypothetical protein